jgi:hypothetical protein
MVHVTPRGWSLLALLAGSIWGCGDGDDPAVDSASVMCRGQCKAGLRCYPEGDLPYCVEKCSAAWWDAQHTDPDAAQRLAPCLERFTCDEVFGSDEDAELAYDRCWEAASLQVVATPELRELCARYSVVGFECAYAISTEQCEQRFGMWEASIRDQVHACLDATECGDVDTCIAEVFERP